MVEAGTYVRNLNPMKKPQMSELFLSKYLSLIEDIEDEHIICDAVHVEMLKGCKGAKKSPPEIICGGN